MAMAAWHAAANLPMIPERLASASSFAFIASYAASPRLTAACPRATCSAGVMAGSRLRLPVALDVLAAGLIDLSCANAEFGTGVGRGCMCAGICGAEGGAGAIPSAGFTRSVRRRA